MSVVCVFFQVKIKFLIVTHTAVPERARQKYRDAPQCACSPTGSLGVCRGPTSRVVTGTVPATMFVYTEPLAHPNNQRLRAFLIPTQSQWSQVELATGAIRYSNTAR